MRFDKRISVVIVLSLCLISTPSAAQLPTSGSADIDRVRAEVRTSPTTAANYRQRSLLLITWIGSLQQQSADTHPLFDFDDQFNLQQNRVLRGQGEVKAKALEEIGKVIDEGYRVAEKVFQTLREKGPIYRPFTGDPATFPEGGDMNAEWPMFQGNKHNTGYSEAPGPKTGELAWKFPVGLGWYARPTVEGDRVYVASPGMRTTSLCLDLETGERAWQQRMPGSGVVSFVDGHLVVWCNGELRLAHASRAGYEEVAVTSVFDNEKEYSYTTPTYANGRFYLRNHSQIAAVRVGP